MVLLPVVIWRLQAQFTSLTGRLSPLSALIGSLSPTPPSPRPVDTSRSHRASGKRAARVDLGHKSGGKPPSTFSHQSTVAAYHPPSQLSNAPGSMAEAISHYPSKTRAPHAAIPTRRPPHRRLRANPGLAPAPPCDLGHIPRTAQPRSILPPCGWPALGRRANIEARDGQRRGDLPCKNSAAARNSTQNPAWPHFSPSA